MRTKDIYIIWGLSILVLVPTFGLILALTTKTIIWLAFFFGPLSMSRVLIVEHNSTLNLAFNILLNIMYTAGFLFLVLKKLRYNAKTRLLGKLLMIFPLLCELLWLLFANSNNFTVELVLYVALDLSMIVMITFFYTDFAKKKFLHNK